MTGKTHKTGGMLCAMVGFILLRDNGLLFANINPILQLLVIYPFAMWGSICSDLDHHWTSCPDKSIFSRVLNFLLHIGKPLENLVKDQNGEVRQPFLRFICNLTNAKHRSWQTHSDFTLICMLGLLYCIMKGKLGSLVLSEQDVVLASLIVTGVVMGIIAHFIYDMLTPEGIILLGFVIINRVIFRKKVLPEKMRLVPKMKCFATGRSWETFIRKLSMLATWLVAFYIVITTIDSTFLGTLLDKFPYQISIK